MGVSVASLVEPVPTPTLAIVRACEESVYKANPCVGPFIIDKGGCFFGRWEKTGEIEGDPAYESGSVGGGGGLDVGTCERGIYKVVDRIAFPRYWRGTLTKRFEGPVALVGSPLCNPSTEEGGLCFGETFFFGMWRRHRFVTGGFRDAVD